MDKSTGLPYIILGSNLSNLRKRSCGNVVNIAFVPENALERTDDDFCNTNAFLNHCSIQEIFRVVTRWELEFLVLGREGESDEALRHENQRLANTGQKHI